MFATGEPSDASDARIHICRDAFKDGQQLAHRRREKFPPDRCIQLQAARFAGLRFVSMPLPCACAAFVDVVPAVLEDVCECF